MKTQSRGFKLHWYALVTGLAGFASLSHASTPLTAKSTLNSNCAVCQIVFPEVKSNFTRSYPLERPVQNQLGEIASLAERLGNPVSLNAKMSSQLVGKNARIEYPKIPTEPTRVDLTQSNPGMNDYQFHRKANGTYEPLLDYRAAESKHIMRHLADGTPIQAPPKISFSDTDIRIGKFLNAQKEEQDRLELQELKSSAAQGSTPSVISELPPLPEEWI